MNITKSVIELSNIYEADIIKLRRKIHEYPELAFKEIQTSGIIKHELEKLGLEVQSKIAQTGLVSILKGAGDGKVLLLRADMDALPIEEMTGLPFSSKCAGVMHACGHDVHSAVLVGVARILKALDKEWRGTIKLVFQPAEESGGGGRKMIQEGILENPHVDACLALHVNDGELPGTIAFGKKNVTAYSDKFIIKILGKSSHSAEPQEGVDAIYIAAHIIIALNSIVKYEIAPSETATFSIGQIQGGTAPNIISNQVELVGMMRNTTKETRIKMIHRLQEISQKTAETFDGKVDFTLIEGYTSVYNDENLTEKLKIKIKENYKLLADDIDSVGDKCIDKYVFDLDKPFLGAEDFGFYSQERPSCFFRVGTGNETSVHTPQFMVDEKYMKLCVRTMAISALEYLND